ncbi:hypothetical protein [Streptomyces griseoaurantiacus]|uniref:hypothetical protein n=1 Tax=Streptomyces griseoaurantiacus TaxID=68213 RepID=UPI003680FA10
MTTTRIKVPAAYLAAHRAAPADGIPAPLAALLDGATLVGRDGNQYAPLDVPTEHLPALAALADTQFRTWGEQAQHGPADKRPALRLAARAAYLIHHQAARALTP